MWRAFRKRLAPPMASGMPAIPPTSVHISSLSVQSLSTAPTSSPILRLSQELLDGIIDAVAILDIEEDYYDGGFPSICACSLVFRGFLSQSRWHLFSKISIGCLAHVQETVSRSLERIKSLYYIMKRNPQIVAYIQELTLKTAPGNNTWITEDPYFRRILARL
ncbi:hypothetical protein M413DRAFT_279957 [Hebeloma cylindrosporum]|uniref:Uncharacterized protein n=1 Tax=Hebeloma cylindrosporum TaxID=76867 RepID=A0A0C3BZV4_HEBCY|nr:hypothetical protein M413DRAFT_279957 [Hebeloma cylindrosporum h7]